MSKSKKTDVLAIYPLKGEHKKPKHVKPHVLEKQTVVEQIELEQRDQVEPADIPDVVDLPKPNEVLHLQKCMITQFFMKDQKFNPQRLKRPNPLLEPSSYPQVMAKQLPRYEGLLKPQLIEIELRGRLPSYDVDKAIEKYPFTMNIPSLEEKKRKLFHKIPEDTVFRRHIPKQVELDKFIDALKEKVIHDYNIPIRVKPLRAEYKRSPYFRDIVIYIKTGYCSYVGKALFKMLCEDYILMDDILFKIRYVNVTQ